MAAPIFSARFEPTSSTPVSATQWDVLANIYDGTGEFSGLDVALNDMVFLDCFPSLSALNTVGRYKVILVNALTVGTADVRLEWNDDGPIVDPSEVLNTFGFISRASLINGLAWHAAPTIHNLPDYVVQYARNKELKTEIDAGLGGGGGGSSIANVALSPAQILALHTTPVTLVAAPGAGMYHAIESCEIFLDFASIPYTGGGDISIDYLTTPVGNLNLDQGCLLAATDSRRYGEPVDNPLPDITELSINESLVIRTSPAFISGNSTLKVRLRYRTYTSIV